jgi:hypothetical protein
MMFFVLLLEAFRLWSLIAILSLGIFDSGLWGNLFFQEMNNTMSIMMFCSISIILLVGTVMVSIP